MSDRPYSRVKDFVIPIYNYRYFHKPSGEIKEENDPNHIDRKNLIDTILDLLETNFFSGVYLITGFRGSGKTSLVKRAILRFTKKSTYFNKYYVIETNLSGAGLTSFDVLKNITWAVYKKYSTKTGLLIMRYLWLFFIAFLSYATVSYWLRVNGNKVEIVFSDRKHLLGLPNALVNWNFDVGDIKGHAYIVLLLVAMYLVYYYLSSFIAGMLDIDPYHKNNLSRLNRLNARISSNESHQLSEVKAMGSGLSVNRREKFKELTEKEISFELEQIISNAQRRKLIRVRFIFIIDELDKIEILSDTGIATAADQIKRKKDRIFQLLGELKQFFVNAKAKFFCITGAEMYDASLADITERDSYLGSIFHRVVYVPSFFSDFNNHTSDITSQTEQFLCQFLSPGKRLKCLNDYFDQCYPMIKGYSVQHRMKLYFILQSFIGYLTFRAKGSPKKIVTLFEENLIRRKDFLDAFCGANKEPEYYLGESGEMELLQNVSSQYLLHFDEFDQYKIGLTSVLNSPFLYSFSLFITNHSDKLIISSSFLWDHIYKYHNAAFSEHHLEYIHELISNTKDPETKKQLAFLLSLLKSRCVREIRSGLFDFKFTARLKNEIAFLSNVIQTESAVYNFTLDEAINLKRYYHSKLDEAKNRLKASEEKNPLLTGFLARTTGDLYFYDQEFDQAIIYYEEALTYYYSCTRVKNSREWVDFIRWNLLLSLTYEKCGHYTKAFAICCDLKKEIEVLIKNESKEERLIYKEVILYSKVFHHTAIQKLMLIEKTGLNGIKPSDLEGTKKEVKTIYGLEYAGKEIVGFEVGENWLIQSEVFHKINNILYFRNTGDSDELFCNDHDRGCYATVVQKYLVNIVWLVEKGRIDMQPGKVGLVNLLRKVLLHPRVCGFTKTDPNLNYALACGDYLSKAGNALIARNEMSDAADADFLRHLFEGYSIYIQDAILENELWAAFALYNKAGDVYQSVGCYGEAAEQYLKILYLIRDIGPARSQNFLSYSDKHKICRYAEKLMHKVLLLQHQKDDNNSRVFLQKYKSAQRKERHKETSNFSSERQPEELFSLIKAFPNAPDLGEALVVFLEVIFKFDVADYNKMVDAYMASTNEDAIIQSQFVRLMELRLKGLYNYRKYNDWCGHIMNGKFKISNIKNYKCLEPTTDSPRVHEDHYKLLYHCCIDSIYCFLEVLRIISVQRNDFMIGHAMSASMYSKLAQWSIVRRALIHLSTECTELEGVKCEYERKLRDLIHSQNVAIALSAKYNFEKAIEHYEKADQTHRRGASYREFIHQMYMLEDDLNDEFTHFMLSLERMKFSRGVFSERIMRIREELKHVVQEEANSKGRWTDEGIDWVFYPADFLRVSAPGKGIP
jgi:hypothetical protein